MIVTSVMELTRRIHLVCPMSLLALSVVMLSIVGCGGKSSARTTVRSDAPASASASGGEVKAPAEFISRADSVCAHVNAEIRAVKARSTSAAEVIRVVPRTLALERKGIGELERLNPPASMGRDWRLMLDYRRTLASQLAQLLEAARKNSGASVKPLGAAKKRVHASLTKTAVANGFKDCGKVGNVG